MTTDAPPTVDEADRWDDPLPLGQVVDPSTFPTSALPGWLDKYVTALSVALQVPEAMAGTLVLAALATAAGGRVCVRIRDGWVEPTNLFVAIAAPPASRKSPVFKQVVQPLLDAERALIESESPRRTEALTLKRMAEDAAAAAARTAGDTDAGRQAAVKAALEAADIEVPPLPQLIADDATPESIVTLLAEQGRVAVLSAEGGPLEIAGGRYSRTPNLEALLKGHAGDMIKVNRKGRDPEFVERPALTMGLAVQPQVLEAAFATPEMRGRGLLARFLYAVPESNIGHRAIDPPAVPSGVADRYRSTMRSLVCTLAQPAGDGPDGVVELAMTADAAAIIREFEAQLEPQLGPDGDIGRDQALTEWAGKLAGAVARIAGLLHVAEHCNDGRGYRSTIDAGSVARACRIALFFLDHARVAFKVMATDETTVAAAAVVKWLRRKQLTSFSKRDAYRALQSRFASSDELDVVLALLEDREWVRKAPESPRDGPGRRPAPKYEVNPKAFDLDLKVT